MTVFLQNRHTESVKRVDISGIIVPCQSMNPLSHFIRCFVCKCYTEYISGKNAEIIHQISKPMRESPRFSGAGSCDNPDKTFRACNGFFLRIIQFLPDHAVSPFAFAIFYHISAQITIFFYRRSKQIEKRARFLPETGHILIQLISFFTALMIRLSQSTLQVMQPSALRPRHCLSGDTCMYRAR